MLIILVSYCIGFICFLSESLIYNILHSKEAHSTVTNSLGKLSNLKSGKVWERCRTSGDQNVLYDKVNQWSPLCFFWGWEFLTGNRIPTLYRFLDLIASLSFFCQHPFLRVLTKTKSIVPTGGRVVWYHGSDVPTTLYSEIDDFFLCQLSK